jgi:DNA end-binding protein Ku
MEAMRRKKVVGIARVVMGGRERLVALRPRGKGALLSTLRYSNEVRGEETYFDDFETGKSDKKLLELAEALIEQNMGDFDPAVFTDRYSEAVLELVKAKIAGETIEIVEEKAMAGEVISLMDALRQSVEAADEKKPPAKRVARKAKKKKAS